MSNTKFKTYMESCSQEELKAIALELVHAGILSIREISIHWYPNNLAQKAIRETSDSIHNLPQFLSEESFEEKKEGGSWLNKSSLIQELWIAAEQMVKVHNSKKGISMDSMMKHFTEWEKEGYIEEISSSLRSVY